MFSQNRQRFAVSNQSQRSGFPLVMRATGGLKANGYFIAEQILLKPQFVIPQR
jgi:hypothetical protein